MLTLISATPGSGKTLKAVELIYECLNNWLCCLFQIY